MMDVFWSFAGNMFIFRFPSNLNPLYPKLHVVEVAALVVLEESCIQAHGTRGERVSQATWRLLEACSNVSDDRRSMLSEREVSSNPGPEHKIVVTSSGTVYSFGNNDSCELGHGTLETYQVLLNFFWLC